jgi:hypothetical protein
MRQRDRRLASILVGLAAFTPRPAFAQGDAALRGWESATRPAEPIAHSPDQAGGSSPGGLRRLSWYSFCARFRSSSRQC